MGLDVSFGMMYGINFWDGDNHLLTDMGIKEKKLIRYNRYTGKEQPEIIRERAVKLNYDFLNYKKGDEISFDDFQETVMDLQNSIYEKNRNDYDKFVIGEQYIGVKSFVGKGFYERPQDFCFEYKSDLEYAITIWEEYFPNIPAKEFLYLHASY